MSECRRDKLTMQVYEDLLSLTNDRYRCIGYNDIFGLGEEKVAVIRHDIDISPTKALEIAKIEENCGVKTTYTVLLTGEFYSPLEKQNISIIKEIKELGHCIGLHFDARWHNIRREDQLEEKLYREKCLLEELVLNGESIEMFSFHNTTSFTMSCKKDEYCGMVNSYSERLQQDFEYTSDSNGYWIYRSWEELIQTDYSHIHLLTHPEWWDESSRYPGEKVCKELLGRSQKVWLNYNATLTNSGRINKLGINLGQEIVGNVGDQRLQKYIMYWLDGEREVAILSCYRYIVGLINDAKDKVVNLCNSDNTVGLMCKNYSGSVMHRIVKDLIEADMDVVTNSVTMEDYLQFEGILECLLNESINDVELEQSFVTGIIVCKLLSDRLKD